MRSAWARLGLLASIALGVLGCEALLGLNTDRTIDDQPYPEEGYQGCADGDCARCTNELHRCQCDGGAARECETLVGVKSGDSDGTEPDDGSSTNDDSSDGSATEDGSDSNADTSGSDQSPEPDSEDDGGDNGGDDSNPDDTAQEPDSDPSEPDDVVAEPDTSEPDTSAEPDDSMGPMDFMGCESDSTDACGACICDNCEPALKDCVDDPDCSVIWDCTSNHECDPSLANTPGSCYRDEFCRSEIDSHGGLFGRGVELLRDFTDCVNASCSDTCGLGGGDPNANCTPADDCKGCFDCHSECMCGGGTIASCDEECGLTPAGANWCSVADDCNACTTCLSTCRCSGKDLRECEDECGHSYECFDGQCSGCADASPAHCECEGNDPSVCARNYLGGECNDIGFDDCEICECDECPSEYVECRQEWGCFDILNCMDSTRCVGAQCSEPWACESIIEYFGGPGGRAHNYAEALLSCRAPKACPCGPPPTTTTGSFYCGSNECFDGPSTSSGSNFWGCCAEVDRCGLDLGQLGALQKPNGGFCYATTQFGVDSSQCPSFYPAGEPYSSGEELRGCCRNTGTCGYWDTQLGLGCVEPEAFGMTSSTTCMP